MARKNINIGSGINTGTGDTLRNAMSKVNDNFEELYNSVFGGDSSITAITVSSITAPTTNGTLTLAVNGTGDIVIDGNLKVNTIASDDSTAIQINDSVNIRGSLALTTGTQVSSILDEDTLSSDSDTALATQQSIKAYVDAQTSAAGSLTLVDDASSTVDINLATDSLTVAGGTGITTAISGDTITITGLELLDEDNLSSNSATAVASQQSIKAYVDSQITSTNTLTIADDTSTTININLDNTLTMTGGDSITTSVSGQAVTVDLDENITVNQISSTDSTEVQIADNLVPTADNTYALGSADKKWSALHVAGGSIFLGDLVLKDNGDNSLGIFQSNGTTPAGIDFTSNITIVGDDSTGVVLNSGETLKIAGAGISTTEVSGDVLTITTTETNDLGASVTWVDVPDANITQSSVTQHQAALSITQSQISDFNSPITVVGDDSTGVTLNTGETIKITGTQNITSTVSGDTLTLTGPDLSSFITTSTLEFVGDDSTGTVFDAANGDNVKFAGTNGIAVSVSGDTITIDGTALAVGGGFTFVGDDSTGTVVSLGETFKIAGTQNVTTAVSGDVLTVTGPNLTSYVQNTDAVLTLVGDDSTGTVLNVAETFKIAGTQNITTAVSGDTLTVTGPDLSSYLTDITFRIVGDDSASVEINNNGTILFNGESNITTSTTSDGVVTITGPANVSQLSNDSGYITASSSDALTNKTIDANGTGNSITNLEVADFAAGVVDTDLSSVSGADDTLASAKSIKTYVDNQTASIVTTMKVVGDDSATFEMDLASGVLQLSGGDSITTSTSSTNVVTFDLNESITVNEISSTDSTAVVISDGLDINGNVSISGDLQANTISAPDSTVVQINDGVRIDGALNVQSGAEIYGTLYAQEIGAEDSTQLTFLQPIQVRGTSSTINDLTITTNDVDTVTVSTQGNEDLVLDADTGDIRVEATLTQFTSNVQIDGNLTVNGTETIVNTTNLQIEDNQIVLARNNSSDVLDIGFFGHTYPAGFDSTVPNHVGFFRDATNAEWYLIGTYSKNEDQLTIDRTDPSFGLASLNVLSLNASLSLNIGSANISETDLEKIDGITDGTAAANKALVLDASSNITGINSLTVASSLNIGSANMNESDLEKIDDITNGTVAANKAVVVDANSDASGFRNITATGSFIIGSASMNETDLEKLDDITDGTGSANKALVLDGSSNIANINQITATTGDFQTIKVNTISSDDSTAVTVNDGLIVTGNFAFDGGASVNTILDEDGFGSDSDTALATQQSIKAYVDAEDANIASDSLVFTNKTIDANGTGNSITNLEVADFASGVVDTDLSSVSASDDTLASAKAIKAYVDTQLTGESLSFQADSGGTLTVDLDSQTFGVTGGDSITTVGAGQSVTIDLDETITVNRITSTDSVAVAMEGVIVEGYLTFGGEGDPAPQITSILDEDGMGSDSDTALATQQSIKAYVDSSVGAISTTTISEANSSVVVADSGSGSVTVTIDGATHTTFDANGLSTNVLNSTDSTAIQVTDALNVSGAVTAAGGFVGDLTGTASAVADNSVALSTKTTGNYVDSLVAGALIDLQNNSGEGATPTIDVDLSELTTSTTDGDGDYFVVVDSSNVQRKLTKANIAISGFNTANGIALGTDTTGNYVGTITGGTGIDSTGATTGEGIAHTLSINLNELTTSTSNADGDFFVVVDSVGAQKKLTKANIDISEFNTTNQIALGTDTTGSYVQQGATSGNGISGSVNSEGGTFTVTSNATNANTGSTIVFRDGSGNFSAGTITANLSGTATTATNVTATANDTANETVYLTFVDGQTGSQGIETDVNLTYNPSTNVISSTAAAAQYSDLAERFEADAEYEMGTVMVIGGEAEVTQSTQEGSTDVVGIVSSTEQAGFTMNTGAGTDATHPLIALAGRVQIKVVGPVNKGDRLIASATPGCARRADLDDCTAFNVIGRALETKTTDDVDTVLCLTVARL